MPRAYIRRGLLVAGATGGSALWQMAPNAAGAVNAFRECGWEVVVVGGAGNLGLTGLDAGWTQVVDEPDRGAWLITDQVADDRWAQTLGLHTALIESRVRGVPGPARCDVTFRDLRTAALEILAKEAAAVRRPRARAGPAA